MSDGRNGSGSMAGSAGLGRHVRLAHSPKPVAIPHITPGLSDNV